MTSPRIYCSGPLFNAEEVGGMTAIARVLEDAGMATFLPHRDGLEPYVLRLAAVPAPGAVRRRIDAAIFALDVYELLDRCDGVVCSLNGRVPDEGMIVEASLAAAAGVPLVLYKSDARAPFGGGDNAMLTNLSGGAVVSELGALPQAVRDALAAGRPDAALVPALRRAVRDGRRIAGALALLPGRLGKQGWTAEVVDAVLTEAFHADA